jgi:hypothetical protein
VSGRLRAVHRQPEAGDAPRNRRVSQGSRASAGDLGSRPGRRDAGVVVVSRSSRILEAACAMPPNQSPVATRTIQLSKCPLCFHRATATLQTHPNLTRSTPTSKGCRAGPTTSRRQEPAFDGAGRVGAPWVIRTRLVCRQRQGCGVPFAANPLPPIDPTLTAVAERLNPLLGPRRSTLMRCIRSNPLTRSATPATPSGRRDLVGGCRGARQVPSLRVLGAQPLRHDARKLSWTR